MLRDHVNVLVPQTAHIRQRNNDGLRCLGVRYSAPKNGIIESRMFTLVGDTRKNIGPCKMTSE